MTTRIFPFGLLICGIISTFFIQIHAVYPYYGTKIGSLSQLHHGVSGDVYAVDSRTLFLKNFNYDGEAPAAYFYVGNSNKISNDNGIRLRDERGSSSALSKRYRNKDITLSLPEGKTLRDIKWFSVWCDEFSVNFGDVRIPSSLNFPKPQKLTPLNGVHGVSSDNIVIVDAQTLLVPNFSYDGEAPDAKFWVGRGPKPSPQGLRIPDENGKEAPLRRYDHKTIVLTLPGDLTIFDIGHFGVWCEAFTVDFGHIRIPEGLNVPPSLKMLGISPQSKLNCEILYDDLAFEVRWAVAGESVVVQLVAKLEDGEYMSFGISPSLKRTEMIGADAVVAWVDKETGKGFAQDYYLDAKSQCSGGRGSCPDTRIQDNTNSIRLLNAAMVNGYSIVTYQRSLKASDKFDLPILINDTNAIVWAIGPLNERKEVSFHSKYTKGNQFINFGRQPTWNCPMPEDSKSSESESEDVEEYYDQRPQAQRQTTRQPENNRRPTQASQQSSPRPQRKPVPTPKPANTNGAWEIPPIQCYEPEDGVFYAQMGPTGGKHGYPAITGHVGWGISWYINGLLIPEIHVVRGKTYTFVTEGGNDPEVPAKYHPFYITDDPIGGYEYKTDEEKSGIRIFAGVHRSRSGKITPTGVGRLCNWTPNPDGPPADDYVSFGAYQRTLTLKCDAGEPGIITWTPDKNTPDTVYYHCFTHRHLGWKIHVHDTCEQGAASEIHEVVSDPYDDELVAEPSIRYESKVRPSENFLLQHEKDLIKNHNMNGSPPKIQFELSKSSEITKLISDGIRAAEALEESISKKNQLPPKPDFLQGEIFQNYNASLIPGHSVPEEFTQLSNSGLPTFLVPPQNPPVLRPIKVAGRFPPSSIQIERRPNRPPQRPVVLPQPSVIVNHYQKPVPPIIRPFIKKKPFPIQPIASVLLLGQQTELGPPQRQNEPLLKSKLKPGSIPVPYIDSIPQDSKKAYTVIRNGSVLKTKKPIMKLPNSSISEKISTKPIFYKKPYEVQEETEVNVTFKPAVNTGFIPESVVVEGGFKPIVRKQKTEESSEESEENINRRQDTSSDIDEAMEGDAPIYNEDDNKSFEPMFIPSPPDSTNVTIIREAPVPLPQLSSDLKDMDVEDGDDKIAVAAERLDTYYLPPRNKVPPPSGVPVPDGAVVTYDGKAVLDTSLVNSAPPRIRVPDRQKGLSKAEQLLRTPQFGPFKGEIPPPVPEFLSSDAPQNNPLPTKLQVSQRIHSPITEYSDPLSNSTSPISTKLTLLSPKTR